MAAPDQVKADATIVGVVERTTDDVDMERMNMPHYFRRSFGTVTLTIFMILA